MGPSGSGKSTLLKLMNQLRSPSEGEILYKGKPVRKLNFKKLRQKIGMVFQQPIMVNGTVYENLTLAARWNPAFNPYEETLIQALNEAGLSKEFLQRDAGSLSGGEKQRVSIARTLLNKPEVLLLDEPTTGMDPQLAQRMIKRVFKLKASIGLSVVMVTHHPRLIENRADKILFLKEGEIDAFGGPEILSTPPSGALRQFLQSQGESKTHV